MREILLRAKRIDNGEWVEGDGIHYPKSFNWKGTCWIDGMRERANDWVQVDPETVCQYIGKTDKNGVKIFEGDIVNVDEDWWNACGAAGHTPKNVAVEWNEIYNGYSPFTDYDYECSLFINPEGVVVIGNIFDNLELLKGGAE